MSTSISGRVKRLGLAGGLVGVLLLGCLPQMTAVGPLTVADAQRQGKMGKVTIAFGPMQRPETWASQRLRVQAADVVRVNRVKITLLSADGTYKADQSATLSLSSNEATFAVPFGRNFIALAQGLDGETEVPGVYVAGYFDVKDTGGATVHLTPQTTPVAEIVRYLMVKSPTLAPAIDLGALQAMVDAASASTSPAMISPEKFAEAIIANKGIPNKPLADSRFVAGRIKGKVQGLAAGEVAIISVSDPASRPFVLVGTAGGGDDEGGEYVIDNVVPGTWRVRLVTSNSVAKEPEKIVTLGVPYVAPTPLPSGVTASPSPSPSPTPTPVPSGIALPPGFTGPEVTVDFDLTETDWSSAANNVSSNVGISDQPDAVIDGADNIHLVWRQDFNPLLTGTHLEARYDKNQSGAIYYSRWNGTSWSREHTKISGFDQQGCREPAIAVGVDRLPHVIWSGLNGNLREIRYARFDGTAWTKPKTISTGADDNYDAVSPDLAVDKINGHLYAVWQGGNDSYPYFAEYHGNGWTKATRLSSQAGVRPRVVTGYDGSIHVVWLHKDYNKVRYLRFINGGWDGVKDLDFFGGFWDPLAGHGANTLDLDIDRANRVHLVWRSGKSVAYAFNSAGNWSQYETINRPPAIGSDAASEAVVHVDRVGMLHTLWRDPDQNELLYRRRTNQGWQPTANLGKPSLGSYTATAHVGKDRPLLLTDSKGNLNAIWSHPFPNPGGTLPEMDVLHLMRRSKEN